MKKQIIPTIPLYSLYFFKNDPKRRSYLDIQRMKDSIIRNGFINPILIWQSPKGKVYVVDGVCRVLSMLAFFDKDIVVGSPFNFQRGTIPVIYLDVEKKDLKEIIIASHGSYSIMTEKTLKAFVGDSKKINLHEYAFAEGSLIDFYNENLKIDSYFTDIKKTVKENKIIGGLFS